MKRPPNFAYWLDDKPPHGTTLLSGLQHIGLVCSFLPIPLAVAREAGLAPGRMVDLISVSMLALGVTAIIQALTRGPVGSGLLAPSCFSGAYLAPSLLAVKTGGLPLVFGMTMFGGLIEAGLSRVLRYLRPFLPPEIAGFVVVMVGVTVGGLGVRYVLGVGAAAPASARELAVSAVTLGLMVGLNVWGRGAPRLFCALLGIIGGYVAGALLGVLVVADFARVMDAPLIGLPAVGDLGWSFDVALIIPFAVGATAACLKTVGDLTTCQRINDADWVRPDMRSIGRGTLANGIGSALAGFLGTTGLNTSSANIGLAGATGVTSRRIAYATGGIFLVLAFMPMLSGLLSVMPRPVMGAALMFVAAFIFVNGLQIIASRLLDARRTFVIGLSFIIAIAVDISPAFFRALPASVQPLVGSSLVAGMLAAILLNLIFRIGARRVQNLVVPAGRVDPVALEQFMEANGASWGARRDIINRATFNLAQSIEVIMDSCEPQGPVEVAASFDEFNLDLRVSYVGPPLELPEKRPTNEEIMDSEDGQRKLAGFMLRRHADRVRASHNAGRSTVLFHFDH
jgi:NCS2 family nucleobase:cation symporter-2